MSIAWEGSRVGKSRLQRSLCLTEYRPGTLALAMCCLLIAAVSVHDAILVVLNANVIGDVEKNPIGRWLIEAAGGEIWLFVSLKLMGTAIVCATLVMLYEFRSRLALTAGTGVASFQACLLWYLTFAEC